MRLTPDEEFEMMEAIYFELLRNRQEAINCGVPEWLLAVPTPPELRLPRQDWRVPTPFAARKWKR